MRLIDADELECVFIGKHYGVNAIEYFIKMQPTIDAMPIKHGRWIRDNNYIPIYECCFCHARFDHSGNYCGNCGARMDGDAE